MLCRNCYKMVSDDARFCPECGAELNQGESDQDIGAGFDAFDSASDLRVVHSEPNKSFSTMPGQSSKQSKLGIVAAILSILGCTSGIGLILGIIDLVKNKKDGNKHGSSIFAVIWGGGVSFVVVAFMIIGLLAGDYNSEEVNSGSIAEEPVTRTEITDDNAPDSDDDILDEKSVLEENDAETAVETKEAKNTENEKTDEVASVEKKELTQEIGAALSSELTIPEKTFKISDYPEYKDEPYIEVNNDHPFFEEEIKKSITPDAEVSGQGLQYYSALDQLGRCGMAYEIVSKEILPTEERGQIGDLQPSGWQTVKYPDVIEDLYLYNRCHLIGYQLGGGNGDEQNLITGTRYLNMSGMLPFENTVVQYVEETENHVAYRVTPIFENDNLVASGVLMEAFSIEDSGAGVDFCIYAYNIQPGIEIDYATGESKEEVTKKADEDVDSSAIVIPKSNEDSGTISRSQPEEKEEKKSAEEPAKEVKSDSDTTGISGETVYITKTGDKYHRDGCSYLKKSKIAISKEDAIKRGKEPCSKCKP